MPSPFRTRLDETAPFESAKAVTKSDTVDVPGGMCRALYVGVTGDVTVITASGDIATFVAVPAGFILPGYVTRVKLGGTSASILALS